MARKNYIKSEDAMYLNLFDTNKGLSELIEERTKLGTRKRQLRKDMLKNTKGIKETEEKLPKLISKLKEQIDGKEES